MRKFTPHILAIVSIIALTCFFMRGFLKPGLPLVHDSNPHISRMIAFHTALKDGQFPPMWAKEVLGGIGSPVMMLNYQLPYFVSEGFVRLGLNYFESYKLALALSLVVSGIIMYLALARKFSPLSAWIGAMIYTLAPYRFVDIYVRGAFGESLAFIFPPLLILGFTTSSLPVLIIGWAGLFLTHPLAAACFSAFFLGYTIFVGKKDMVVKRLQMFFGSYAVALLLSAFNLVPTLALTKYTYYSPALSGTLEMFPTLSQLLHSPWGYGVSVPGPHDGMSFELGVVQWLVLLAGLAIAIKSKKSELRYLMAMSVICLFFVLPISTPVYQLFHLGNIIDFPWRLLLCLVFVCGWIGASTLNQLTIKPIKYLIAGAAIAAMIAMTLPIAHNDKYWHKTFAWFARETGDSYGEYAPLTRQTRDSAPFWKRAETIEGQANVDMLMDKSNRQIYKITANTPSTIRINTSYFPGWKIWVDDKSVLIGDICYVTKRTQKDIDDSGLMACKVGEGEHKIEIAYVATPVQKAGNLITLLGIGIYLWILSASYYRHITSAKRSSKT